MNCEKCGKIIPENIDYCPSCKAKENLELMKSGKDGWTVNKEPDISTEKIQDAPIQPQETASIVVRCQCGQELEANWKFCPKCNSPINVEITSETPAEEKNNDGAHIFIIIFIILVGAGFCGVPFAPLGALLVIITAYIKYPKNRTIKILFWLYLFLIVLAVLFMMWMIATCMNSCPV